MNVELILQRVLIDPETNCWNWTRCLSCGYGVIRINKVLYKAHRVSYEATHGPIPNGLVLDHLCRNRKCCNPQHLQPVTIGENVKRGFILQKHCSKGHEFTPENTTKHHGRRRCKACRRKQRES